MGNYFPNRWPLSVLLIGLKQKGYDGIASFIDSVFSDEGPWNSPTMYRKFVYELSHKWLIFATRLNVDILSYISRPFEQSVVHSEDNYPLPTDRHLAFFPSLPKLHDDENILLTVIAATERTKKKMD